MKQEGEQLMMTKEAIMKQIHKKVIISCQALEDEPLYGADIMAKMAIAAQTGGATGIRAKDHFYKPTQILSAKLGNHAGIAGAARHILDQVL